MSKAAVLELCSKVYKAQRDYLQTRLKERIPEGIELCHVEIFNELRKTPGIGINELAKRCGRVKSTVSVMCERLCKLGYLEKRPEGKGARAFGLWLTQSAAEVLKSADAAGGIEGCHGVLKHHGHIRAPNAAELLIRKADQLFAAQADASGRDLRHAGKQAYDGLAEDAFAASGLSDNSKNLSPSYGEGEISYCLCSARIRVENDREIFYRKYITVQSSYCPIFQSFTFQKIPTPWCPRTVSSVIPSMGMLLM